MEASGGSLKNGLFTAIKRLGARVLGWKSAAISGGAVRARFPGQGIGISELGRSKMILSLTFDFGGVVVKSTELGRQGVFLGGFFVVRFVRTGNRWFRQIASSGSS